jgi:NhaA family Na+:H+ antiporter
MRVFLLALAIVDDIASLIIIAAVYSSGIRWGWLAAALAVVAVATTFRRSAVHRTGISVACGVALWWCLYEAGANPTLSGVAIGLLTPMTIGEQPVAERLEHLLHPWASYVIVPLFAVANTGIAFTGQRFTAALRSPITWAIVVARVVGKPLGIVIVRRVVRGRMRAPADEWPRRVTVGVATSAGMGFTVALFIAELALHDEAQRWNATFAIVLSAVLAGAGSLAILGPSSRRPA